MTSGDMFNQCSFRRRRYPICKVLFFVLIFTLYIPYSLFVNYFMCVMDYTTCCRTHTITQQQLNRTSSFNNLTNDIQFSVNNDVCKTITKEGKRVWLLIGVLSNVHISDNRNIIRQLFQSIWNRNPPGPICLVFIVSKPTNQSVIADFEQEMRTHKDIVQIDKKETYRNLVYKTIALLKWADEHVRHFDFLLKMDDNIFLQIPNLFHKLIMFSTQHRFMMGHILVGSHPQRYESSKHFISEADYPNDTLPNYMNGPSYVISGDLVKDLLKVVPKVPLIYVEDVYITGLLVSYVGDAYHIGRCDFVREKVDLEGFPIFPVAIHDKLERNIVPLFKAVVRSLQWTAAFLL